VAQSSHPVYATVQHGAARISRWRPAPSDRLQLRPGFIQRFSNRVDHLVDLGVGDDQGRAHHDAVTDAAHHQAVGDAGVAHDGAGLAFLAAEPLVGAGSGKSGSQYPRRPEGVTKRSISPLRPLPIGIVLCTALLKPIRP
jgi:hypothetical protein